MQKSYSLGEEISQIVIKDPDFLFNNCVVIGITNTENLIGKNLFYMLNDETNRFIREIKEVDKNRNINRFRFRKIERLSPKLLR